MFTKKLAMFRDVFSYGFVWIIIDSILFSCLKFMILTILTNRLYEDVYWVVLILFTVLATFMGVGLLLIKRKFLAVLGIMLAVILNFSINYFLLYLDSKRIADFDLPRVIALATFPFMLSFLQIIL